MFTSVNTRAASAYKRVAVETSVQGADPHTLVGLLFDALLRGEGARAQALAVEHTEVAQMNMRLALERRAESEQVMPVMRLVVG